MISDFVCFWSSLSSVVFEGCFGLSSQRQANVFNNRDSSKRLDNQNSDELTRSLTSFSTARLLMLVLIFGSWAEAVFGVKASPSQSPTLISVPSNPRWSSVNNGHLGANLYRGVQLNDTTFVSAGVDVNYPSSTLSRGLISYQSISSGSLFHSYDVGLGENCQFNNVVILNGTAFFIGRSTTNHYPWFVKISTDLFISRSYVMKKLVANAAICDLVYHDNFLHFIVCNTQMYRIKLDLNLNIESAYYISSSVYGVVALSYQNSFFYAGLIASIPYKGFLMREDAWSFGFLDPSKNLAVTFKSLDIANDIIYVGGTMGSFALIGMINANSGEAISLKLLAGGVRASAINKVRLKSDGNLMAVGYSQVYGPTASSGSNGWGILFSPQLAIIKAWSIGATPSNVQFNDLLRTDADQLIAVGMTVNFQYPNRSAFSITINPDFSVDSNILPSGMQISDITTVLNASYVVANITRAIYSFTKTSVTPVLVEVTKNTTIIDNPLSIAWLTGVTTNKPTRQPTTFPTKKPSTFPSKSPSTSPTVFPTSPTLIPTLIPTLTPTSNPSFSPTQAPTYTPSFAPTLIPTNFPTVSPTRFPTIMPSCFPTNEPSLMPSVIPTFLPSGEPTFIPTILPTNGPTLDPSTFPSFWPSSLPTKDPTYMPTYIPTLRPSSEPSVPPSEEPTGMPTLVPTLIPTNFPTVSPTRFPTITPSCFPTNEPSLMPSVIPTFLPSGEPTFIPTILPTDGPTLDPSTFPSVWPSSLPTTDPTRIPTFMPTIMPSFSPSGDPSRNPTLLPTLMPTNFPTLSPTDIPTVWPTCLPTNHPSFTPTLSPTIMPSGKPTLVPTLMPTNLPSGLPSVPPAKWPTNLPSPGPSFSPSWVPSISPTDGKPSWKPTWVPTTARPTGQRTVNDSITIQLLDEDLSIQTMAYSSFMDTVILSADQGLVTIDERRRGVIKADRLMLNSGAHWQGRRIVSGQRPYVYWVGQMDTGLAVIRYNGTNARYHVYQFFTYLPVLSAVLTGDEYLVTVDLMSPGYIMFNIFQCPSLTLLSGPRYQLAGMVPVGPTLSCGEDQASLCVYQPLYDSAQAAISLFQVPVARATFAASTAVSYLLSAVGMTGRYQWIDVARMNSGHVVGLVQLTQASGEVFYHCVKLLRQDKQLVSVDWGRQMTIAPTAIVSIFSEEGEEAVLLCASDKGFDGALGNQLVLIALTDSGEWITAVRVVSLLPVEGACRLVSAGTRGTVFAVNMLLPGGPSVGLLGFVDLVQSALVVSALPPEVSTVMLQQDIGMMGFSLSQWAIASIQVRVNVGVFSYTIYSSAVQATPLLFVLNRAFYADPRPSALPTKRPTFFPTWLPTRRPSSSPSVRPSRWPSYLPSVQPTFVGDTHSPTLDPSLAPVVLPPTRVPTVRPSLWPSFLPSWVPTFGPTPPPTKRGETNPPTRRPSLFPTTKPTKRIPTSAPSRSPSGWPSWLPTLSPSRWPTFRPSAAPTKPGETNAPTVFWTFFPTFSPTLFKGPTFRPSPKNIIIVQPLIPSPQATANSPSSTKGTGRILYAVVGFFGFIGLLTMMIYFFGYGGWDFLREMLGSHKIKPKFYVDPEALIERCLTQSGSVDLDRKALLIRIAQVFCARINACEEDVTKGALDWTLIEGLLGWVYDNLESGDVEIALASSSHVLLSDEKINSIGNELFKAYFSEEELKEKAIEYARSTEVERNLLFERYTQKRINELRENIERLIHIYGAKVVGIESRNSTKLSGIFESKESDSSDSEFSCSSLESDQDQPSDQDSGDELAVRRATSTRENRSPCRASAV